MTSSISSNDRTFICDWLKRTNSQYDEATPKKIKAADHDRARESLGLVSNVNNNYFFSSSQPASQFNVANSTTNNIHNTHVHVSKDTPKKSKEKEKTEKEKTNWKAIAAIGVVSTAVAGISIFVYARLSKAAEGTANYLENTKAIESWAKYSSSNLTEELGKIAKVQLKIDRRAVDKVTNYKYSILTSLIGTLAIAGGGITIFAAVPALATAGTTAVVAGGVFNSLAVMYAAYNCGVHWSDEKDGKKEFSEVKQLIPGLIKDFQQPLEAPPSYEESEAAIRNQRANPSNSYPHLFAGVSPSAPDFK
ncbi:hypothetical protein RHABOEDO_001282 [Candidatus Rhabdochlamydia oedothoracis]|uniref:Transmembrane protein n=1 Tax=Candidatus Rhabdochlamydia oedothoracis TaxID=2720720 RepID=A0ABX8V1H9_9BACT|nr:MULTISPECIES: hypothetical protein [Rhabdochlamydia]KAG6558851.1 hypothetical protein RHOW815_001151 [Candidatus Rhabdochlamydia sp. W815]QYF49026.1 hypothetical protein RHABOEDO_001282 [Candidatus Rhabdochlamydia oedothoracis]